MTRMDGSFIKEPAESNAYGVRRVAALWIRRGRGDERELEKGAEAQARDPKRHSAPQSKTLARRNLSLDILTVRWAR